MQDIFKPPCVLALEQYQLQRDGIDPGKRFPEPILTSPNTNPQPDKKGNGKKEPPTYYLGGDLPNT